MSLTPFVTTHPEMFVGGSWRLPGIGSAVAMHEIFVYTGRTSAASHAVTEAANVVAAV